MKRYYKILIAGGLLTLVSSCEKREEKINEEPVAIISASPTEGNRPLAVSFDAHGSYDPEQSDLTYEWDFGDGTTSNSVSYTKTYSETGTFIASLTVADPEGLEGSDQVTIRVNEPPDLFPLSENAQWIYRVRSTETENGAVSDYEEGILCLVVEELNLEYENIEFITLRVTGKRFYNRKLLADYIYVAHSAGKTLKITHDQGESYKTMIDLSQSTWNDFAMFFTRSSSQAVTQSVSSVSIGLGNFSSYRVRHHRDNWGEQFVTERYDITEEEYYDPDIGLLYRSTSRYVDFLDCSYCPVYGGGDEIELIGYYIPMEGGSVLQVGTGYNPDNPYGGDQGLLTFWSSEDIGYTEIYLDGEYVGLTQYYFPDGISCDQFGAVNVFRPDGSYTLTAESNKGYYWEGTVYFTEGSCETVELQLAKKGGAGKGQTIVCK